MSWKGEITFFSIYASNVFMTTVLPLKYAQKICSYLWKQSYLPLLRCQFTIRDHCRWIYTIFSVPEGLSTCVISFYQTVSNWCLSHSTNQSLIYFLLSKTITFANDWLLKEGSKDETLTHWGTAKVPRLCSLMFIHILQGTKVLLVSTVVIIKSVPCKHREQRLGTNNVKYLLYSLIRSRPRRSNYKYPTVDPIIQD